jgi:UDP-N-acetylglucosamine 2-epimerase (non-hydrolysing)
MAAISAKKNKIPIFHMEAGNRSFDQRVPEETNRKIVDHIADINLTYSSIARENLLREGLLPDRIINTGSPLLEVIEHYKPKIMKSKILENLNLKKKKYFLISAHREENIDNEKRFYNLTKLLNSLVVEYGLKIVVSTHPRTKIKIKEKKIKFNSKIQLVKPLGFFDYIKLQINSKAVISDSGSITEESSILNFPALNIRDTHERHEGMEESAVMMSKLDLENIRTCLKILQTQSKNYRRLLPIVDDYNVSNVSEKVLRIIYSYTDYINRKVWNKK